MYKRKHVFGKPRTGINLDPVIHFTKSEIVTSVNTSTSLSLYAREELKVASILSRNSSGDKVKAVWLGANTCSHNLGCSTWIVTLHNSVTPLPAASSEEVR